MFQFPGFALPHGSARSSTWRVAPFGHARIKSCLRIPAPFRSLPRPSSPPDSLGIHRSPFFPFSSRTCHSSLDDTHVRCESRVLTTRLLLPIEIVVRKFRFLLYFQTSLSFALPLIYSLSIIKELHFEQFFPITALDSLSGPHNPKVAAVLKARPPCTRKK